MDKRDHPESDSEILDDANEPDLGLSSALTDRAIHGKLSAEWKNFIPTAQSLEFHDAKTLFHTHIDTDAAILYQEPDNPSEHAENPDYIKLFSDTERHLWAQEIFSSDPLRGAMWVRRDRKDPEKAHIETLAGKHLWTADLSKHEYLENFLRKNSLEPDERDDFKTQFDAHCVPGKVTGEEAKIVAQFTKRLSFQTAKFFLSRKDIGKALPQTNEKEQDNIVAHIARFQQAPENCLNGEKAQFSIVQDFLAPLPDGSLFNFPKNVQDRLASEILKRRLKLAGWLKPPDTLDELYDYGPSIGEHKQTHTRDAVAKQLVPKEWAKGAVEDVVQENEVLINPHDPLHQELRAVAELNNDLASTSLLLRTTPKHRRLSTADVEIATPDRGIRVTNLRLSAHPSHKNLVEKLQQNRKQMLPAKERSANLSRFREHCDTKEIDAERMMRFGEFAQKLPPQAIHAFMKQGSDAYKAFHHLDDGEKRQLLRHTWQHESDPQAYGIRNSHGEARKYSPLEFLSKNIDERESPAASKPIEEVRRRLKVVANLPLPNSDRPFNYQAFLEQKGREIAPLEKPPSPTHDPGQPAKKARTR